MAVVGAGAAGLAAAIFAGREASGKAGGRPLRLAALDSAATLGAKILISGGGRCNITHDVVEAAAFNGSRRNQIAKVLRSFPVEETIRFFAEIGVGLEREATGKLFPESDKARTVLDALIGAARAGGAELRTACRVTAISPGSGHWMLNTNRGEIAARTVVLATGGASLPKTGSDGHGYRIAASLGHTVTATTPALVPLLLPAGHWMTELSGISVEAELALAAGTGKLLRRERGSLLFTHFGLSGPLVLDISRHWIALDRAGSAGRLTASLLPGEDFASAGKLLLTAARQNPRATVSSTLRRYFPERLADALAAEEADVAPATPLGQLGKDDRRRLAHALVELPLPVTGERGWQFAEVTAGGVPLGELDLATMESRRCPGLFLCGEILDAEGRIGGYNFQWAWASGRLAGIHAARRAGLS